MWAVAPIVHVYIDVSVGTRAKKIIEGPKQIIVFRI